MPICYSEMKLYTFTCIFLIFAIESSFAQDCSDIAGAGHSWPQGQNGEIHIPIPAKTYKWKVEMTYDKLPNRIDAWQGKSERCNKKTGVCSFQSEGYNKRQKAGNNLIIGYGIQFNESPTPPVVTSVKFLYCDARPCAKWKAPDDSIKELVLCPEDSSDSSTPSPTAGPSMAPTST